MNKKSILALLMALMLSVSLAACGDSSGNSANQGGSTEGTTEGTTDEGTTVSEVKGLEAPIAEGPILLTSVGQSADVNMVEALMNRSDMEFTLEKMATEADLEGMNTLILAIGGSSKGLGAAGIDANQELDRVQKLVEAASENGVTIIAMHVGGEARRGDLSDKFIGPSFEKADYAIVVAEGDKDGLMAGFAAQYGIPMDTVNGIGDAAEPLKAAFK